MQPETHSTISARHITQSCAVVAAVVGLVCGVSWITGPPPGMVSGPGCVLMAPLTAWLMVLLGAALFLRAGWHASKAARMAVFAITALVAVFGLVILWMRFQGLDLLFESRLTTVEAVACSPTVARMAPLTAWLFVMAAVALACLLEPPWKWRSRALQRLATGTSAVVILIISGVLLGYSSGAHVFTKSYYMPLTMSAALDFILLAVGTIALTLHGERWLCHVVGESWVGVDAKSRRFRARLLVTFVLLVAAIAVTGSLHLRRQVAHAREVTEGELAAIARLKSEQIATWRAERLRDARLMAHTEFIRQLVQAFLDHSVSESAEKDLKRWLSLLTDVNRNARAFLLDRDLKIRLALPERATVDPRVAESHAEMAFQNPEPAFIDLHRDTPQTEPRMGMVFGILPPGARGVAGVKPIAAVLLQLDPQTFLYPLIQSWPTASASAETGLIRRDGDRVVFLNELRHRANAALNLSFPVDSPELPAAIFIRNGAKEKLVEGYDYRGVPVLALFRWIPDSPWILGAKVDQEEVFASLRQQTWVTIFTLILLIAVVTLVVVLLWRQRLSDSLRRELTLERERKQLADRLALLMRHANDIIVLADSDWRIVDANERALQAYGYTLEEMRRLKISDLRAQESRGRFTSQMAVVQSEGSAVFEAIHRRKNGSSFRVEISSRVVEVDGVRHFLAITRDITERRKAEAALRESERLYHSLVEHLPQAIYRIDRNGRITFANARCCEQLGCVPQDLVGKSAFDLFAADQATRYWNNSRHVMETGNTLDTVERHLRPDGREAFVHIIKSPLHDASGQIVGVQCLLWDVTERKRAEEALRTSEARYRFLFENMLNGFAYCRVIYEGDQAVDFVYVAVNNAFEILTGLKNVVGRKVSEVIPGICERDRELIETYGRVARTGAPEKFETYVESLKMWFSISVYRPQEGYFVAVFDVITKRKEAELALRESEERYRLLADNAEDFVALHDTEGHRLYVSPSYHRVTGWTPEELEASSWQSRIHPEDLPRVEQTHAANLAGQATVAEYRVRCKDGSYICMETRCNPLAGPDGKVQKLLVWSRDVTQRRRAEDALRVSEEHYRLLADNTDDFVSLHDAQENRLYISPSFYRVTGWTPEEVARSPWNARLHPDDVPAILQSREANRAGRTTLIEHRILCRNGSWLWIEARGKPLTGPDGRMKQLLIWGRDITKRKQTEAALREAEQKYRSIFENAVEGIFQSTPDGRILSANPAMAAIHGYASPAEFIAGIHDIGRQLYVDPDRREEIKRLLELHGEVKDFENRVRRKDGRIIWVSGNTRAIRDDAGKTLYYEGTVEDITARKEAEDAVARSRAELKAIYEHAPVLMCLLDARRRVLYANQAFTKFTGVPESELIAGRACGVFGCVNSFEDPQGCGYGKQCVDCALRLAIEDTIQTGREHRDVEYKATLERDGKRRDVVLLGATALVQATDQPTLLLCLVDITARKEAEEAVRASQSALLMAQRLAHVGNWEWNSTTDQTSWSEELFHIFGRDPQLGPAGIQEVPKYFTPESWTRVKAAVEDALAHGTPYACDAEVIRDNGEHRWVTTRGEPARAADGAITGLHGSIQDITNLKRAADEIHQLNQTLELRVRERTAQLEASNQELESFCYSVSHDLRAPLRAINGFANILSREHTGSLNDEGRRTLGIVCAEAERMGQLIDDLLEFSRIGRQNMRQAEIDMTTVARRAFKECAAHEPGRDIRFTLHPLPPALSDPALMPHVWINLLSNAIKYTRPRPTAEIEVSGRVEDGHLVYRIKDNGVGFDMQYADKLFGVFQRMHGEGDFEGTGVGLALVQRIILRHGGRVWAEARVNEGATFYFALPAKTA